MNLLQNLIFKLISCDIKKMTKICNILCSVHCLFDLLSSYTHSMTLTVECTHSTVKPLNLHIQWLLAIESVHSMAKPLNLHIQ